MAALAADVIVVVVCLKDRGRNLSSLLRRSPGSPEACVLSPFLRRLSLTPSHGGHSPLNPRKKHMPCVCQIQNLCATQTAAVLALTASDLAPGLESTVH